MSGPLSFAGFVVISVLLLAPSLGEPPSVPDHDTNFATPQPDTAHESEPREAVGNGYASRELKRSGDGHFYARAQVNGAQVDFLVDTGATFVALTPRDARRAGISADGEKMKAFGAGGELEVTPVRIDRIALGPLVASNVGGAVIEELPVSLLGQSYLSQIGSVRIEGDRMILR